MGEKGNGPRNRQVYLKLNYKKGGYMPKKVVSLLNANNFRQNTAIM
jgi:hypothetical protein